MAEIRARMVEIDLRGRGIADERVLAAMGSVPRHEFVPREWSHDAYGDHPLPIGEGQTISQPYIVALMTEALRVRPGLRVVELGTGSGYQTAILAELGASVWTIERSADLARAARRRLESLGYGSIEFVQGDGTLGLPDEGPFDRILATGSLPSIPDRLLAQLCDGGIFVGPVGRRFEQSLVRVTYHPGGSEIDDFGFCRFVPLLGADGWPENRWSSRGEGR
jgi:protein-L-isoaspartate(D-aspartate) O-methyltransferase